MINSNASIVPSPAGPSTRVTPFLVDAEFSQLVSALEASLAAGKRMTVKAIAVTYQMAPTRVRAELVAYYSRPGSPASITFRKGRTGGIMLFYKTTG